MAPGTNFLGEGKKRKALNEQCQADKQGDENGEV